MVEIVWDEGFAKILKKWSKKHPDLISEFEIKLKIFAESPFHPSLKMHSLSGNLKGYWSIRINYEYRLIFNFVSQTKVLLIDIGTHDEVY